VISDEVKKDAQLKSKKAYNDAIVDSVINRMIDDYDIDRWKRTASGGCARDYRDVCMDLVMEIALEKAKEDLLK